MSTIARVFPRRTKATPCDDLAFMGPPDLFVRESGITEVHVSVAFTWDIDRGKRLSDAWDRVAPVQLGGPALARLGDGQAEADFVAGRYLAPGYTITSRGCPRACPFCRVPSKVGALRELLIVPGWKVQDDNLLACSRSHFEEVIAMLQTQRHRAEFTGGLEALSLEDWHVNGFASLKPEPSFFFAYDPGDSYETLAIAARKMIAAGFSTRSHRLRCYVLIGFPPKEDTLDAADRRLNQMLGLGYTPMAMLYRHPKTGAAPSDEWRKLQRKWARPASIHAKKRI
jgi:hypothetical protein